MIFNRLTSTLLVLFGSATFGSSEEGSLRGFVSVEPYEIRLEALARIAPYRETWRIPGEFIGESEKQALLDNFETLLLSGVNLTAPGQDFTFTDQAIRFVVPDEEKGFLPDTRDEIPVEEALVGITFSSTAREVRDLKVEWLWFAPGQEKLVLEIASRGKPSARFITPENNTVSWKLDDSIATSTFSKVPPVERYQGKPLRFLLLVGLALFLFACVTVVKKMTSSPPWVWILIGLGVLLGFVGARHEVDCPRLPTSDKSEEIVYGLLRNIYHAFDFRDAPEVYDTLEKSVEGPLLEKIYLEIQASLELESSGGPRVRVSEVALREANMLTGEASEEAYFVTSAQWVTIGEITHWGHTHERTNRYEAELTITAVGEEWKVSDLDLLNEERVQKVSRKAVAPES